MTTKIKQQKKNEQKTIQQQNFKRNGKLKMKRVLPDSNFYELMLKYLEVEKIRKIKESL